MHLNKGTEYQPAIIVPTPTPLQSAKEKGVEVVVMVQHGGSILASLVPGYGVGVS